MIEKLTKSFECEFGVDEKIEVVDGNFAGSKGYVAQIIIDRNGIQYDCTLTHVVDKLAKQKAERGIFSPKGLTILAGALKSRENT